MTIHDLESVLRDFRQKVCDCATLSHSMSAAHAVRVPCIRLDWQPLTLTALPNSTGLRLSDGGLLQRRIAETADADTQRRVWQQLTDEARPYRVDWAGDEFHVDFEPREAGDALSRFLQFLSRCDTVLKAWHEHTSPTRDLIVDRLLSATGLRSAEWLDIPHPGDPGRVGFQPIRIRCQPPWHVLIIETDCEARNAIAFCQALERQQLPDQTVAVYHNQMRINRRLVAQLTNLVDRQFASIGDGHRLEKFVRSLVSSGEPAR